MSYRVPKFWKSRMRSVEILEGETLEQKIERIVENKEPIKDGAPIIFTERKDGIIAAYNIRTDRWEVAADAMDAVARSHAARREERAKGVEDDKKPLEVAKEVSGAGESTQGEKSA